MAKDRRSSDRQARRRDNQGSKPPAEGQDPLRTRARAAPAGLGVKGERKRARAEAGRAGGGVPPAVAGEGEGAEKLRSPRPAPEGSTTPREERLPRRGAGLMRPRCEQHHGWLGAGLAPAPSQAPLRDQGARPGAGSARGGGPSLGAPHHGTNRGGGRGPCHDYATARGLPLPSPVPSRPGTIRTQPYISKASAESTLTPNPVLTVP